MEKMALGVRKGAWTKEEDILLRKCIEKYGEGRWHLVPLRAGLNRCRKSCRLRWLNYLRPNIKRGYFTKDEVDLIVRLHKLLGNRWSLIAGRIPGRTANDVKNFWNTHIDKKSPPSAAAGESFRRETTITRSNIIRPRPRTFSKKLNVPACPRELLITSNTNYDENEPKNMNHDDDGNPKNNNNRSSNSTASPLMSENDNQPVDELVSEEVDECMRWWGNLLEIAGNENGAPFSFPEEDHHHPVVDPMLLSPGFCHHQANNYAIDEEGLSSLDLDDVDIWQLVGMDN